MKRPGRHPDRALTATTIRTRNKPGRYADGGGLYLEVDTSGAKRWLLRITAPDGKGNVGRRDFGLGGLRDVSLLEARERAAEYRRLAKAGRDPLAEKRSAARIIPTFRGAAERVHAEHSPGWRNSKHAAQWINTLEAYAFPILGERPVDQIDTPELLKVLAPIWLSKPETARRVRQRIKTVLDWSKAAGFRTGDNPVDGVVKGLPRQVDRQKHHAALPYTKVPAFLSELAEARMGEVARLAFELLILTATRTSETIAARKSEFDLKAKVWTIPPERMKAGREHRVPLSARAVQILEQAFDLSGDSPFAFASRIPGKPLSNMVLLMALRRMGRSGITAHGFRSAFRDWASERTNFPAEVAEMALAHTIKDKTEAAYRRGDLFEKRRQLMDAWAAFALSAPGKVISLVRNA